MTDPDEPAFAERFELAALLGSGATASVFRARDRETGRDVAVKILHPRMTGTEAEREGFLAEARAASRVAHPGVPDVLGSGVDERGGEPQAWIATALAPGETLSRRVDRDGPLEPAEAALMAASLLDVLAAVHSAGLVHRDVSPGNIVLGDDGHVSLLDFGLADAPGRPATGGDVLRSYPAGGGVIGSVNYLSPEQALGRPVDAPGDLYAAAGVLHFAVTGRPPFVRATTEQVMAAHVGAPPPVPSALDSRIPRNIDAVVTRGLMKSPADRFADAAEMAAAARAAAAGASTLPVAGGEHPAPTVLLPAAGALPARLDGAVAPEQPTEVLPRRTRPTAAGADRSAVAPTASVSAAPTGPATGSRGRRPRRAAAVIALLAGAAAVTTLVWLVAANAVSPAPQTAPTEVAVAVPEPTAAAAPAPAATRPRPTPSAPRTIGVPSLPGLPVAEATAQLTAAGLRPGVVTPEDGTAPEGTVLRTSPAAGQPLAPGASVSLVVASGRNAVPAAQNLAEAEAGALLSAAGFAVVERTTVDATLPDHTVIGTEPAAGTRLPLGTTVTLVVSRQPAVTTPTPTQTPTPTPSAARRP